MQEIDPSKCKATTRSGKQCGNAPLPYQKVCRMHGGSSPNAKKGAEKRRLLEQATRDVQLWGGRRDVHPAQALLELVQSKAAEVAYWESRIAEMDDHDDLGWGTTEWQSTPEGYTTTKQSGPVFELAQLHEAQKDLAQFAAASLRAGVDNAMVKLAQHQASQIVAVLRAALTDPRANVPAAVVDTIILEAVRSQSGAARAAITA